MSSARSLDSHSEIYDENEDGLPQHSPHSFISMHESNITLANGVENVEDVAHAEGYGLNVNDSLVLKADDIARINVSDTSNIDMTKEESSIGGEDDYGEGVSEAWPDLDAALLPLQQQHIQNERAVSNPEQEPIGEDQPEVLLAQYSARLLSKWGLRESSLVTLRRMAAPAGTEAEEQLEWRSITPGNGLRLPLTANMRYVDAVSRIRPALISVQLVSLLPGHETTDPFANQLEILLEFNSDPEGTTLAESAAQMLEDSRARMRLRNTLSPRPADLLSFADMQGAARSEQCLQLNQKQMLTTLRAALDRWVELVRTTNEQAKLRDRLRWQLHAAASMDADLQAWYHSLFFREVYRPRGAFWYKDAALPSYRRASHRAPVQTGLTLLEEAALAHVLCSPETTYSDVAGQMFVMQAVLSPPLFTLFQTLASSGLDVVKYPRSGRPALRRFRFSFVEGGVYLTWAGKFGNQGVDLADVRSVQSGITTDVLKRSAPAALAGRCLSLRCDGRSLDLCLETEQARDAWQQLLQVLVAKEAEGRLPELLGGEIGRLADTEKPLEALLLYESVGKFVVSPANLEALGTSAR